MNSLDRFLLLREPLGLSWGDRVLPLPIGYTPPVIIDIINQERRDEPQPVPGAQGRQIEVVYGD